MVCGLAAGAILHSDLWTLALPLWIVFELHLWWYEADTYYLRLFFISLIAGAVLVEKLL